MTNKINALNHQIPTIHLFNNASLPEDRRTTNLFAQGIVLQDPVKLKNNEYFQKQEEKYRLKAEKISKKIETIKNFITDLKNPEISEKNLYEQFLKIAPPKLKEIIKNCLETAFPQDGMKMIREPRTLLLLKNLTGDTPLEFYIAQQRQKLNDIEELARCYSHLINKTDLSEKKQVLRRIQVLESSRPSAKFTLHHMLTGNIHHTDTLQTSQDLLKLHQLQDFYLFLNAIDYSKEFIFEKFQGLDLEIKEALGKAVWLACYTPPELFFTDRLLTANPYLLLDCINAQGTNVIIQLMAHYRAKIGFQRFKPKLITFAKQLEATNDKNEQLRLFHSLPEFAQADLVDLVQIKLKDGDGIQQIKTDPQILVEKIVVDSKETPMSILDVYLQILDKKIKFDLQMGIKQLATEKSITTEPTCCDSIQLMFNYEQTLPHVRVAMVAAEFAGVINIGGLAPAVAGITRGYGADDVCVILPKYDVINPKLILKEKEKYRVELNGEIHRVFKAKVNGMTCYFIEDELFNVGCGENGKPNNIYEGHDVKRRWAHFQSLSADLVYTLSKQEKNPVQLVHIHDAQTALVPKILATRHYEEWQTGETPAVVFTFHNNNNAMTFEDPQSLKLLEEIHLASAPINSFIEGLEASDMNTTVSKTFAKEVQTPHFGKGMQRSTKINAMEGKLTGIVNGNAEGWNPETDLQLKQWISSTGKIIDLSYSATDPDLFDKIKRIRKELVDYLRMRHLGDFDVTKPIFLYVGRYDAYQKGIDKLPIIMEEVLKNGGQFICIGTEPDAKADATLKQMEEFARRRNNKGVSIIRDFKRPDGRLFWQHGNVNSDDRTGVQGCGSILRAATDVGVFPSMFEPCGLVQGEMHRMGVETIATATGGFVDTIFTSGKNRNGYLFPRLPTWESIEQDEVIRESIRGALQRNQDKLKALYADNLDALEPYLTQKRTMMTNAARSTWISTFDGSLSPIERYRLVYTKALENRQKRECISVDMHALGNPSCPLEWMSTLELNNNQIIEFPDFDHLPELTTPELNNNKIPEVIELDRSIFIPDTSLLKLITQPTDQLNYKCESSLALLWQLILRKGSVEELTLVLSSSTIADQNLIFQMVWEEAGRPMNGDTQWGEHHVFDCPILFALAVRNAIFTKLARLSQDEKNRVYGHIYELAGRRQTPDIQWGETYAKTYLCYLADAISRVL